MNKQHTTEERVPFIRLLPIVDMSYIPNGAELMFKIFGYNRQYVDFDGSKVTGDLGKELKKILASRNVPNGPCLLKLY